jgi:hypothetical protein
MNMVEEYRLLAAVIAAHPNREVVGRTRLQKTIKLLQRLGLPTSYGYTIHFYGPYSEDLQSEVSLLENVGLASEEQRRTVTGDGTYFVVKATPQADPKLVDKFCPAIELLAAEDPVILELAATYDAFREEGDPHPVAMDRLRRKKGSKLDNGNDENALGLLGQLGLPTN